MLWIVWHLVFEEHNLHQLRAAVLAQIPQNVFLNRESFRIKESWLLFQCLIIEPGGMFYLQYKKPLAEHFPRLEISQGRAIFVALSFLWQSHPTLNSKHSSALSLNTNHILYLNRNLRQGPRFETAQRVTLFCSLQFPLEPLSNGTFWLSFSLSLNANRSCDLHRVPQLPLYWACSGSQKKGSG